MGNSTGTNTHTIVDVISKAVVIITIAGLVVGIFFPGTITERSFL